LLYLKDSINERNNNQVVLNSQISERKNYSKYHNRNHYKRENNNSNYHERRTCYICNKRGHIEKN